MWPKRFRQTINPCINYFYSTTPACRKFPSTPHYKIKLLAPCDFYESWNLIKRTYLADEPLCKLLNISKSSDIALFQKYCHDSMASEGISLIAVSNDDQKEIIGVCINNKYCPWHPEEVRKLCKQFQDENMKIIFQCYYHINMAYDIFAEHKHPYVFEMGILAVDQKHLGKSIGYGLVLEGLALARDIGFPIVKVECTSAYSALICHRCKMELVKSIPYEKFELGKVPGYPHCDVKVYIRDFKTT